MGEQRPRHLNAKRETLHANGGAWVGKRYYVVGGEERGRSNSWPR